MKGRSLLILSILLAWFAGMPIVRAGETADSRMGMVQRTEQVCAIPLAVLSPNFIPHHHYSCHTAAPKTDRKQKRHGKTLASPAIVAGLPETPPPFNYCTPDYPTFQAGVFAQWEFASFFLRGPPAC